MTCTKEFALEVVAPTVLLKICDYGTLQPLLIPDPASDASAAVEWDGTFNVLQNCLGDPTYRFQGDVSIQGKLVFQQVFCVGPNPSAPQIVIPFNFGTTWRITVSTLIGPATDSVVWQGDLVAASPIGTYTSTGAGFDPRPTLDICAG